MSDLDAYLHLFKGDWIKDPEGFRQDLKDAKAPDHFTAEIAAWCVEIHEHLRELADVMSIDLMLMGGNGASLRFEAVKQRGSRDNDYLTTATREQVDNLMRLLQQRFADLDGYMAPTVHVPKVQAHELDMVTYMVPVPFRLTHGLAADNNVKVEFHFEDHLPPDEQVSGTLGPGTAKMTARLPGLPYQVVFKLMTLTADPIGIDEARRSAAVPHQIYDVDLLLRSITSQADWDHLVVYAQQRYERECAYWQVETNAGEPWAGIVERVSRWGDCTDETSEAWKTIHRTQQSQLKKPAHLGPWGWHARAFRIAVAVRCMELGASGWSVWLLANSTVELVPEIKAKRFKAALAELSGRTPANLPLALRDFVWQQLLTDANDIEARISAVRGALESV